MKKINVRLLFSFLFVAVGFTSFAQLHPPSFNGGGAVTNFYKDYVGVGLTVTTPAVVAGPKVYTTANGGTGATGDWGGAVTTALLDKILVKPVPDSLGCATITNDMTGKVAFIYRGSCEFGAKSYAAQQKGAIAVIIVNNISGGPVGMGAGAVGASVTIPVFMISKEDGDLINARMNAGDTVKVSFTNWGSGKTHDLGILYNGISLWHNYATPKSQMVSANGNPIAFKGYDGAFIANFGSSTESDIQLNSSVYFTPDGSTTSQLIRKDSVGFSSFPTTDSIDAIGMNNAYDVHPTSPAVKGRFDVNYSVKSNATDEFPGNNTASYSYYITDDVFSKGRYNFETNSPIANSFYRLASGVPYMVGNLYYVPVGNHAALSSQFSVASTTSVLDNVITTLVLYKWTDTARKDSLIQASELEEVGVCTYAFNTGDSSFKIYSGNYDNVNNPGHPVILDSNSWYYVAEVNQGDVFTGFDGIMNMYPRTYLRYYSPNAKYTEFYSSLFDGTDLDMADNSVNNPLFTNSMFVFENGDTTAKGSIDSARFSQQKGGFIPALTLKINPYTNAVQNIHSNNVGVNCYPNPADDVLNVSIDFKQNVSKAAYVIMDMSGRVLKSFTHNNVNQDQFTITTSNYSAGTYLIVVNGDNKISTVKKFIVK